MDKARERKEEQQLLEEKLFKKGQNWKPKLTTPVEPKLSSFLNKDSAHHGVKALSKPVNPVLEPNTMRMQRNSEWSNEDERVDQ